MHDRATWHNFSAGPTQPTGNPLDVAIDGDAFLVVQTAARRALHPQRRVADQRQGELVTSAGDRVLGDGGPIQFQSTDNDISINPRRHHHGARGRQRDSDPRAGSSAWSASTQVQRLHKDGSSLFRAPDGVAPQPAPASVRVMQGAIEQSNVRGVIEMARMIEAHAHLHPRSPACCSSRARCAATPSSKLAEVPA